MGKLTDGKVLDKINSAIDSVRPYLIADGGDVELVTVAASCVWLLIGAAGGSGWQGWRGTWGLGCDLGVMLKAVIC